MKAIFIVAVWMVGLGCGSPPKPSQPTTPDPVNSGNGSNSTDNPNTNPVSSAKQSEPECKALSEQCKAVESSLVTIVGSNLVFKPPLGWFFAKLEKETVTFPEPESTVLQFIVTDPTSGKKGVSLGESPLGDISKNKQIGSKPLNTPVEDLIKKLGIKGPKLNVQWAKPLDTKQIGKINFSFWELEKYTRGKKKGTIILSGSNIGENKILFGIAFVPSDKDNSGEGQMIMTSLESITLQSSKQAGTTK